MTSTMGVHWLVTALLLSSIAVHGAVGDIGYPQTDSWICLTTSGGNAVEGGSVNYSKCGAVCDTPAQQTQWIGWVGAIIAILFFGSNYIPVKTFDTGDGLFFQWILCFGIWLTGLVVNMFLGQPPFFLPVLLGGVLWTTGNLMVVPIVKMIGLTMGLTVWGVTNMLSGWVTGMFILGQRTQLTCSGLNYGGVAMVIISVIVLAFVKSEGKKKKVVIKVKKNGENGKSESDDERTSLLDVKSSAQPSNSSDTSTTLSLASQRGSIQDREDVDDKLGYSTLSEVNQPQLSAEEQDSDYSWVDRLGVWPRRVLGFGLALISGPLYGFMFLPVQFMKMCTDEAHSCNDVDYLFGFYTGILLVSTFYFVVYSAFRLNKPMIYPKLILPGLISGIMWGIAMLGWFFANQHLSLGVSFPIVTAGPGFISSAWGIFLFKEIKGWFNILLYFVAFTVSLLGQVMDGLSRCTVHC